MKKLLVLTFILFEIVIFSNLAFAVVEITIEYPETCIENWDCTDWSECIDGVQTRKCTDSNSCGTTVNKPDESRSCGTCTENWDCTDWSACVGGTQTRTCTDLNNCGTTVNKPSESRGCGGGGWGGDGIAPEGEGETNYGLLVLIVLVVIVFILIGSIVRGKGY